MRCASAVVLVLTLFAGSLQDQALDTVVAIQNRLQSIMDAAADPAAVDKLEDVQAKLQTALDELRKEPPDRIAAAGALEGAIGDLDAAVSAGFIEAVQGRSLMDDTAGVTRMMAADGISAARSAGADAPTLEKAEASLEEGDGLRVEGRFKDAAARYKDALSTVIAFAASSPPQAAPLLISMTGSPSLRRWKGLDIDGPRNFWNEDTYTANVRRAVGGPDFLRTEITTTWAVVNALPGVELGDQLARQCEIRATGIVKRTQMRYSVRVNATGETANHDFIVDTSRRGTLSVTFRFPEDAGGRSALNPDFFQPDNPNVNPTDIVRAAARNTHANRFTDEVHRILKQVTHQVYVVPDRNLGLFIGGFAGGNFVSSDANGVTTAFANLPQHKLPNTINVYCVRQVLDRGVAIGGVVLNPDARGTDRLTVVLSDSADASNVAHEIGHTQGLLDVERIAQVAGSLNNLRATHGDDAAMNSLLMRSVGRTGNLITYPQMETFRREYLVSPASGALESE